MSKAGRPEDGTDPKLINMAEFLVDLKPEGEWRRGPASAASSRKWRRTSPWFPGSRLRFSQPIRDNVLESISQIDGQIVIKVFGDDSPRLREGPGDARSDPRRARRAAVVHRPAGELPQTLIQIDRAAAARYGLNVGDIEDVIETAWAAKPPPSCGRANNTSGWLSASRKPNVRSPGCRTSS